MSTELFFNIFANILGFIAIALSTWAFIIAKRETSYSDLDTLYSELLKLGIEYPKFRNLKFTGDYLNKFESEDDIISYENYAFLSMNMCESIFDRAYKDKELLITWLPAVRNEFKLHETWFENPENSIKFKESFRQFVHKELFDIEN